MHKRNMWALLSLAVSIYYRCLLQLHSSHTEMIKSMFPFSCGIGKGNEYFCAHKIRACESVSFMGWSKQFMTTKTLFWPQKLPLHFTTWCLYMSVGFVITEVHFTTPCEICNRWWNRIIVALKVFNHLSSLI